MTVLIDNRSSSSQEQFSEELIHPSISAFRLGKDLILKKSYQEGMESFRTALTLKPKLSVDILIFLYKRLIVVFDSLDLRLVLAEVFCLSGNYKEAVIELEDLFEMDPHFSAIYPLLGKIYNKTGQRLKIRHIFESAIAHGIYQSAAIDSLTKIYLKEHNLDAAVSLYRTLIEKSPTQSQYYKVLMELYIRDRQYDLVADVASSLMTICPHAASEILTPLKDLLTKAPRNAKLRKVLLALSFKLCLPLEGVDHVREWIRFNPPDLLEAIDILKSSLEQFPNMYDILYLLSEYLIESHAYSEAVRYLQTIFEKMPEKSPEITSLLMKIIKVFPDQYLALSLLAKIYMRSQHYEKALFYYQQLISLNKTEFSSIIDALKLIQETDSKNANYASLLIAEIRFHQNRFEEALMICEDLLDTDEELQVRLLQSRLFIARKQYHRNWKTLDLALKKYPYFWEVHQGLRFSYDQIGLALKERYLKKVSSQEVLEADWIDLGMMFMSQFKILKAIECFQKIHVSSPYYEKALRFIARCFMEMGRFDLVIKQVHKSLNDRSQASDKLFLSQHYFLGLCCLNMGRNSHALHHFELILEHDVGFLTVQEKVQRLKSQSFLDLRGKAISGCAYHEGATKKYMGLLVKNQENELFFKKKRKEQTMSFAFTHNNQGVDYLLQDNIQAAADEFSLAIQMDPSLTVAYNNLAYLYITQGKFDDAYALLERALDLNKEMDVLKLNEGLLFFAMSKFDLAIPALQKSLDLNPDNALSAIVLGDCFYAMHYLDEAFSYWKKGASCESYYFLIQKRMRYLMKMPLTEEYWLDTFSIDWVL